MTKKMTKPEHDFILDCKTMEELGNALAFQTTEIKIDKHQ
jgi:hypothetical protein